MSCMFSRHTLSRILFYYYSLLHCVRSLLFIAMGGIITLYHNEFHHYSLSQWVASLLFISMGCIITLYLNGVYHYSFSQWVCNYFPSLTLSGLAMDAAKRRAKSFSLTPAQNTRYAGDKNLRWLEYYLTHDPIYMHEKDQVQGVKTLKNGIHELIHLEDTERAKYLYCMCFISVIINHIHLKL